jgi:endonuclease/exonuclease/phosphatase family metal-dependent hydrolase
MRLATFNLLHGRSLTDGAVDTDRLRAAAVELDADVLGMQEVDFAQPRSHQRDQTAEVAAATGSSHHRFAAAIYGTPGERWTPASLDGKAATDGAAYGIGLVSRWPVERWHVAYLPASPLHSPVFVPGPRPRVVFAPDEPRVLLAAEVRSPVGPMTVATTHLSFVPGWNVRQLRSVCRVLRQLPAPRVLLGDLNLPAGLVRPAARRWRSLARMPTYPVYRPRVQFDHVLAARDGGDRLPAVSRSYAPRMALSDHRALVVELAGAARET